MKRRRRSATDRGQILDRQHGLCAACGLPLAAGAMHLDHVIALWTSADDTVANLVALHIPCHAAKTRVDRRSIAKIKRLIAKAVGSRRKRKAIASRGFAPGKRAIPSRPFGRR